MNEFEKYPVLTEYIREYASFGHFGDWSGFLATLNEILAKSPDPLPTDLEKEAERLYPIPVNDSGFPCRDYSMEEIISFQRSAYLTAASHFQERVKELEAENEAMKKGIQLLDNLQKAQIHNL